MASRRKKARGSGSKGGKRGRASTPPKRTVPTSKPKKKRGARQTTRAPKRHVRMAAPRQVVRPAPRRVLAPAVKAQLYEAVKLLRKHIHGYEARDGYGLRDLNTLDQKTRHRIVQRAAKLRELTNVPHDLVKAPTKKARKNLHQFTGQTIRRAKHYIVHKPADNFSVHLRNGNVEVEGKFGNRVITRTEYFLFPRRPRYPKELVSMARALRKDMRPGFYVLLTAAHGDTGEPFERDQIINRLNEYLAAYEVDSAGEPTGFSEALIGFRFMATTLDGAVTQRRQIDKRRERQKNYSKKQRKKLIKKFAKKKRRVPAKVK